MKYMIMLYASQQDHDAMAGKATGKPAWSADELAAMGAFMESWNNEIIESGEFVDARGLAAPVHTRRLGTRDGVPFVTDGPYAETQEVLAGYTILECESFRPGDRDRLAGVQVPVRSERVRRLVPRHPADPRGLRRGAVSHR